MKNAPTYCEVRAAKELTAAAVPQGQPDISHLSSCTLGRKWPPFGRWRSHYQPLGPFLTLFKRKMKSTRPDLTRFNLRHSALASWTTVTSTPLSDIASRDWFMNLQSLTYNLQRLGPLADGAAIASRPSLYEAAPNLSKADPSNPAQKISSSQATKP
jgi:hypothetical protein